MAKPGAGAAPRAKKRKLDGEESEDVLAQRLATYGERFLSMFDDAEQRQASAHPTRSADDSASVEAGSSSDGEGSGSGVSDDDDASPADLVQHIFDSSSKHARPSSASTGKTGSQRGAGPAGGAGGLPHTPQQQVAAGEAERLRQERKRFMSSKAAVITSGGPGSQPGSQRRRRSGGTPGSALGGEEEGVSREEFLAMQREVQQLGATALDKKSRKKFEAERLARIGAKAESKPRMAASIGQGMAKKQAQRAERALQEGIAAGMVQLKGMGKRKRREKEKERRKDRGLMEDGGAFRPGVLRVKAPPSSGGGAKGGKRR